MRQTWVNIHSRLDAVFLPQNFLKNEIFIPQRIQSADLKVGWWQAGMALRPTEDIELIMLQIWHVRSVVGIDGDRRQDRGMPILII